MCSLVSRITASVPDEAALANRSGRLAGTNSGARIKKMVTILRGPPLQPVRPVLRSRVSVPCRLGRR